MRLFHYVADFPRELGALPNSIRGVSLVIFLYVAIWGALDPFLTLYFHDIFGNYTGVASISAFVYFFSIFISVPFGGLADIVSKKKLMRIFLILYIPFGFILASLSTFFQFALFSVYHAILATGLWSSAETYVRAHSPPHKASESMGFFDSASALAIVIGAISGGFLMTAFGISFLFYIFAIFVVSALAVSPYLPDHHGVSSIWLGITRLKRNGIFRFEFRDYFMIRGLPLISIMVFMVRSVSFGMLIVLPLFSDKLGASFVEIGLIYAVFALPTVFEAPFSIFSKKLDRKKVLIFGGLASILFLSGAFASDDIISLFIYTLLVALAFALINPVIEGVATELMPKPKIGELNGVYRSVVLLAAATGSFVVGPIADIFSIQTSFLLGVVLMTVFVVVVLFVRLPELGRKP